MMCAHLVLWQVQILAKSVPRCETEVTNVLLLLVLTRKC